MTRALDTAKIQQNSGGSVAPFIAGKNKIINGDFGIWQRGTSFTNPANFASGYTADRFFTANNASGATRVISRQTFSNSTSGLPVGLNNGSPQYFFRYDQQVVGTGGAYNLMEQRIEGIPFPNQIVTWSFWAKANTTISCPQIDYEYTYNAVNTNLTLASNYNIGTAWQRYSFTFIMPSITGTGAAGDFFGPRIWLPTNSAFIFDTWGWQLEAGTQATPFTTATGSIGSELSLCKRYYERQSASSTQGYAPYAAGYFNFATAANYAYKFESEKRAQPTISFGPSVAQFQAGFNGNQAQAANTLTAANISRHGCYITLVPNGTPFTAGQATTLQDAGSAVSYIEISAEL